jgi:uncharacterized membrane protein
MSNLLALATNSTTIQPPRVRLPTFGGAFAAAALFILMGNLVALLLFASAYGIGPDGLYTWLDIIGLEPNEARHWWYPSQRGTFAAPVFVIASFERFGFVEAPFQSILTADLHAQFVDLSFVLIALACALVFLLPRPAPATKCTGPALVRAALFGLVVGATGFTNTWDLPFVIAIVVCCIALRAWWDGSWRDDATPALVFMLAALIAYAPFYGQLDREREAIHVVVKSGAIEHAGSQPVHFLLHWLPLFVIVGPFAAIRAYGTRSRLRPWGLVVAAAIPVAVFTGWAALFLVHDAAGSAYLDEAGSLLHQVVERGFAWLSALLTASIVFAATCGLLVRPSAWPPAERDRTEAFVLLLIAVGATAILGAEFFYVDDPSGSRLVSLFKITYIAWALLGVAAGYVVVDLVAQLRVRRNAAVRVWAIAGATAIIAGLMLPLGAIPNRIRPYSADGERVVVRHTLDGMSLYPEPERAAIDWLRDRAHGQKLVLAESVVDETGASDYRYAGRLSMASGIPTVLAWPGHQEQWRGSVAPLGSRAEDIDRLYSTSDLQIAGEIIARYGIDLIAVGVVERATYSSEELAKFEAFPVAFEQEEVTIYSVP